MALQFTKMQGVGNDFVVVDGRGRGEMDWTAWAVVLCDRHKGVGADGLLVLDQTPDADFAMRMFNPDGSPDVCGNGLRCIARYGSEHGIVTSDTMSILTLAGPRSAHLHRDEQGRIVAVTVDMGLPSFAPAMIPMLAEGASVLDYPLALPDGSTLILTALSTGSAHAVVFVDELPDDDIFFASVRRWKTTSCFPNASV